MRDHFNSDESNYQKEIAKAEDEHSSSSLYPCHNEYVADSDCEGRIVFLTKSFHDDVSWTVYYCLACNCEIQVAGKRNHHWNSTKSVLKRSCHICGGEFSPQLVMDAFGDDRLSECCCPEHEEQYDKDQALIESQIGAWEAGQESIKAHYLAVRHGEKW